MKIEVDLTQAKELKPKPTGVYIIRIRDCKQKDSKAGIPKLSWTADMVEPKEMLGEKFFFDTSLSPDALFHLKNLVECAGVKFDPAGFDAADLFGKPVGCIVMLENTKEYGLRNRVTKFVAVKATKPSIDEKSKAMLTKAIADGIA